MAISIEVILVGGIPSSLLKANAHTRANQPLSRPTIHTISALPWVTNWWLYKPSFAWHLFWRTPSSPHIFWKQLWFTFSLLSDWRDQRWRDALDLTCYKFYDQIHLQYGSALQSVSILPDTILQRVAKWQMYIKLTHIYWMPGGALCIQRGFISNSAAGLHLLHQSPNALWRKLSSKLEIKESAKITTSALIFTFIFNLFSFFLEFPS